MNDNRKHSVVVLNNNDILPNRFQPRKKFSEEELLELTESIKKYGVLEPIIVRPLSDKYELVAGERRYKANVLAGNETIPAIIKEMSDSECTEIAIIENLQRKNLSAIEEALSYKRAIDLGYATQQQLAEKVGKSQSYIANKIRLLKLSDEVQDALLDNKISERHARSLLRVDSLKKQNELLEKIINERLTVRRTDEEIDKMNNDNMNNNELKTTPVSDIFNNTSNGDNVFKFGPETDNGNSMMNFDLNGNLIDDSDDNGSNSNPQFNMFEAPAAPSMPQAAPEVAPQPFNMFEAPAAPSMPQAAPEVAPQPFNMFEAPVAQSMPQAAPEVAPQPFNMFEAPAAPSMSQAAPEVASQPFNMFEAPAVPSMPQVAPEVAPQPFNMFEAPAAPSMPQAAPEVAPQPFNMFEAPAVPSMPQTPIFDSNQPYNNISEFKKPEPIIVTDYSKQYDPVMPSQESKEPDIDMKTIINLIRQCSDTIEKCGYKIDTEEYDLENMYQVVFKIDKM